MKKQIFNNKNYVRGAACRKVYNAVRASHITGQSVTCGGSVLLPAHQETSWRDVYSPIWIAWSITVVHKLWKELETFMPIFVYQR